MIDKTFDDLTYEELRFNLMELPMSWYPDLILHMVKAAYAKKVFVKDGASKFIAQAENRPQLEVNRK